MINTFTYTNFYFNRLLTTSVGFGFGFVLDPNLNIGYYLPTRCETTKILRNSFSSRSTLNAEYSEEWCKIKKAQFFKNGLPAVFDNMARLGDKKVFAKTSDSIDKPINFYTLKDTPGIYMITNKITKKFYIGMSKNLQGRFYNYLQPKRIIMNGSSRIHKAILKYDYLNFSVTILEFCTSNKSAFLRKREDYYIRLFKPQYNIARSSFNRDINLPDLKFSVKKKEIIPLKIKNILDKCLDPTCLD